MSEVRVRIPRNIPFVQLGPIGKFVRDRRLYDVIAIHDGLLLRCTDGMEIEVAFASAGPELKAYRLHIITSERAMPEAFSFMRGKPLDNALWHEGKFYVVAKDGHALRFDWATGQPEARGVDVHVDVPHAPAFGSPGQL